MVVKSRGTLRKKEQIHHHLRLEVEVLVPGVYLVVGTTKFIIPRKSVPWCWGKLDIFGCTGFHTEKYSLSSHAYVLFFFFFFFSIPCIVLPFCSLPPSRNSDPGSHSRLFSPPTHYGSCLAFFFREKILAFSSLVDSRRIVLTHAILIGALSS